MNLLLALSYSRGGNDQRPCLCHPIALPCETTSTLSIEPTAPSAIDDNFGDCVQAAECSAMVSYCREMSSLPPGGRDQRKSHPSKRSALEAQVKSEGDRELKENEELSPKRARRSDPNGDRGVRCSPGAEAEGSAPPTPPPKNEVSPTSTQPTYNATCSTPVSNSNGNVQHPQQQTAVLTSVGFPHMLASGPLFSGPNNNGQPGGGMPTPPHPVFPFHPPLLDPTALQTFFASHGLPFPHPPPPPFGGIYSPVQAAGLRPDALGPMNYYLESAAAAGFHPYGHMDPGRRKNATREVTLPLKNWLNEHRKNPYPTKAEKTILAIVSKMTMTQVSTWFANARRRLKKENKMTWSPRNRTADDDDDDEDEHTGRVGEDGNDRPSSSASALSVDDRRKVAPLLGTSAVGAPLNGLNFNARLEGSFNSSGGSTSALETPRKKGAIWSIADTLTDEGNVSADRQAGTSSSSSNSSAVTGIVEKQRDRGGESGTSHRHNSVVDLSTRAPQPQEASRLKPSSELHEVVGFPPHMLPIMVPPGSNHHQQNPANPTMVEAFAAAFTAFMNGASATMVPSSTPVLVTHSPSAMGLSAFMMPHLMAAGMTGATTPQPASKISHHAALPASQNPLLALMTHQSPHQFGSTNQNASQQQMMAMMAAAMAAQQYDALRQPFLPHGGVMVTDSPPTAVPLSKLNGAANGTDRSVSRNGYLAKGHAVEKASGESSTERTPNRTSSPKVQQQQPMQQQCRRRRDATNMSSPVSNS